MREGEFMGNQIVVKAIQLSIRNLLRIIISTIGLAMIFVFVNTFEKTKRVSIPRWLFSVGSLCMGVYLCQQFILKGLYNYTDLPTLLGPFILPWFSFAITLAGSLFISYSLRLTNLGRCIIG